MQVTLPNPRTFTPTQPRLPQRSAGSQPANNPGESLPAPNPDSPAPKEAQAISPADSPRGNRPINRLQRRRCAGNRRPYPIPQGTYHAHVVRPTPVPIFPPTISHSSPIPKQLPPRRLHRNPLPSSIHDRKASSLPLPRPDTAPCNPSARPLRDRPPPQRPLPPSPHLPKSPVTHPPPITTA